MEKYVNIRDGVELCYEEFGDGGAPPLVLIQGFTAQMIGWNPRLCQLLADQGYRVIRFDNRDIGRSTFFHGQHYDIADMADDTALLIEKLSLAPAHIVGQSMGGMIAQELAIRHPELLASLAIVYSTPNNDYLRSSVNDRPDSVQPTTREEAIALHVESESACASSAYPQDREFLREVGALAYDRNPDKSGIPRQRQAIDSAPDRSAALGGIQMPTLILAGQGDALIDHRASLKLHELIPDASLVLYSGMGHELPEPLWESIVSNIVANAAQASRVTERAALHV